MFFSEKAGRLPINSVSDAPVKDGMWAGYGLLRGACAMVAFAWNCFAFVGMCSVGSLSKN